MTETYISGMRKSVYIETTIPSYYYETRKGAKFVAWREITRRWWKAYRHFYEVVTSDAVFAELNAGNHPLQERKLALLDDLEFIEHVPVLESIIEAYVENRLVPEDALGDAYHLAIASYYEVDFLLTWNCRHLANPNKFAHMHVINTRLNLHTPILCTPEQLLTDYKEK
jgi:predicted nucleic acid-binding protein